MLWVIADWLRLTPIVVILDSVMAGVVFGIIGGWTVSRPAQEEEGSHPSPPAAIAGNTTVGWGDILHLVFDNPKIKSAD